MHVRIVKAKRHPDRAAEIEAGRPRSESVEVREQAKERDAERQPAAAENRIKMDLRRQGREQEAAKQEPGEARRGARRERLVALECVPARQTEVLGPVVRREGNDAWPRQVLEQRRDPSEVRAQIGA